ncbi:NGG1p interacting factor NIF3 [Marinobacter salinisoli]|uniref:NGG1p interacting factor NIF3 n=1 Tax=Marinobacter salinisoli TaxID=2769486 RepID=A0ABX7MQ55_9GAMM|nr:NGG1p interacting factor NIF3 [Marinobacter salinisoli]QSP94279.1 NGG1p interacting factor NIF3 [Marinobacter salinisoli]
MYKLCYFVPASHLEITKQALFDAGAGRIGDYDSCAWQCQGRGQFRPLEGSDPFLGKCGEVEQVEEYKVELVCEDDVIRAALGALKRAHPYEEPAYEVYRMEVL